MKKRRDQRERERERREDNILIERILALFEQ
jgi:hypothetical protein